MPDRTTCGQYPSLRQNSRPFATKAKCEGSCAIRRIAGARCRKELDWPCCEGMGKATIPPRHPVRRCREKQDATHENRSVDIAHENGNLRVRTFLLRRARRGPKYARRLSGKISRGAGAVGQLSPAAGTRADGRRATADRGRIARGDSQRRPERAVEIRRARGRRVGCADRLCQGEGQRAVGQRADDRHRPVVCGRGFQWRRR